ncbi:MAG: diguanylate cyclase [Woeseia sp.]|nr:diguanylate cyclase [Woeseia sp.]MBT8096896.1 diguanylate cyclase [Woeseia sp.]NNE62201.1 diguanylate cyclase [Woeseia sp.]NNL55291.1 diguanylate cyclase [Woeseia sp.]
MTLFTALTAVFVASSCGYVALAARLCLSGNAASKRVGIAFLLVALWVFSGALQLQVDFPLVVEVGRAGHFLGAALLPVVVLFACRTYVGERVSNATILLLCVVPIATILLAATNTFHEWVWVEDVSFRRVDAFGVANWGPWFIFVNAPYSYALLAWSIMTLFMHSTAVAPVNRRAVRRLAFAVLVPAAALITHDLGSGLVAFIAIPTVFVILLPVFATLLLREQVMQFAPLAYETVFQNMSDPVLVVDENQRIIGMNHGAELMLKVDETQALRTTLESLFGSDVPEVFNALHSGKPQKLLTSSGRFLHLQASPLKSRNHSAGGQVLMFRDVSDVERAQQEVRSSEKLLRTLIDHSVNGAVRLRWSSESGYRRLVCVFANAAAGRFVNANPDVMLKCTAEEIIQLACSGMREDEANAVIDNFVTETAQGHVVDVETRVESGDNIKWLRVIGEPVGDNVAVTFVDVTERKDKELQMESMAWSDPLTGVLNRRGFEREATQRLAESDDNATGALLFIDLNGFKKINDSCGHDVGDRLLTIAADRLRKTLRGCDIIGRPGGDEFVALVPDLAPALAEKLATRLSRALEEPYKVGDARLDCPASIGLALYPQNANTLTGLMRAADQAMYRAKARSRDPSDKHERNLLEKAG